LACRARQPLSDDQAATAALLLIGLYGGYDVINEIELLIGRSSE